MYEATATPAIQAAIEEARRQRSVAFWSLFRRTRPNRKRAACGSGLATA